jgi:hypothetical protein
MSSTQPSWPAGLGFGPGDVATLADIAAGKVTRTAADPRTTHGVRQYVTASGNPDGGTIRRYAARGFIAEHDHGPPTLTKLGAHILAEYEPLARAHLDWQRSATLARRRDAQPND